MKMPAAEAFLNHFVPVFEIGKSICLGRPRNKLLKHLRYARERISYKLMRSISDFFKVRSPDAAGPV